MFGFFRRMKRRRHAERPTPPEWLATLQKRLPFHARLTEAEQATFMAKLKAFLAEKSFIGAQDFEITEEVKVTIAAQAVRLVMGLDLDHYNRLHEIIVYPFDFVRSPRQSQSEDDVPGPRSGDALCGEVDDWNILVLSWPAVLDGLEGDGDCFNPTLHEFAHVLDRATGTFDGTPLLRKRADYKTWAEVMSRHYLKLKKGRRPQIDVLDEYGAENEAEFFAVATEAYFECTPEFKELLPDLFQELKRYYGYEPV